MEENKHLQLLDVLGIPSIPKDNTPFNILFSHKEKTLTYSLGSNIIHYNLKKDSKTFLKCQVCGKAIMSGKYCKTCGQLAQAADKKKRDEIERKKREMMIQGVGMVSHNDDGKKRFER